MALDVRGSLKNTRISRNQFIVFEELVSNAIDSYLIRKQSDPSAPAFQTSIELTFHPSTFFDSEFDLTVTCADNGTGLTDDAVEAFITKDTSYKDDLSVAGLGKCKGTGRIQFFHFFQRVSVGSVIQDASDEWIERSMHFDGSSHIIHRNDFSTRPSTERELRTVFRLDSLKEHVSKALQGAESLKSAFSKDAIRDHLFLVFLQRLIALAGNLGDFRISVNDSDSDESEARVIRHSDLPEIAEEIHRKVDQQDPRTGDMLTAKASAKITQYKIDSAKFKLARNFVSLCAKNSPVENITSRYLRDKGSERSPIDGSFHIILVEGDILDSSVNEQRDGFTLPNEIPSGDLFEDHATSREKVFDAIDEPIIGLLGPSSWSRDEVVSAMTRDFGISEEMREETDTRIRHGETARSVVERVLRKYQKRVLDDTAEVVDLKQEIVALAPDSEDFREKVSVLAWKYTSKLKDLDKANLSQLIVRRSAIVEILRLATRKQLDVQQSLGGKKRKDERLIHSIFFPMRADTSTTDQHDIWLLDEEYQYFDYICSDTPLSKIMWGDGEPLFDDDVDAELLQILKKNEDQNAGKRPDIALFHKEGAAIIIEFKAPGVSLDDHANDLMEYAQLLAAKSKGHLSQFYGYLVGDTVNPVRLRGFTKFPVGKGYFGTEPIMEHQSGRRLGELYSEILYYEDIVTRAQNRLRVFSDRIGVEL